MRKFFTQMTSSVYIRSVLLGLVFGIVVTISYVVGFLSHNVVLSQFLDTNNNAVGFSSSQYTILSEVHRLVDSVYLRELPSDTELEYAAIRGMLNELNDPATFFIEPPVAQSESQALAGTYGGIGVQVRRVESGEFALYPFPDGPAIANGVSNNDILLSVNDLEISSDLSIDEVDQLLRGEVVDENGVTIRVRKIAGEIADYFIEFDVINIPSVISRITAEDSTIGYLQILKFTSRTPDELVEKLTQFEQQDISAIVIDLRDNSGGLLVESIEVADQFLESGIIAIEKSRDTTEPFSATSGSYVQDLPLVILVNQRTASASELVAGALRDNGRGILIGQKTFGKGTVQQIFPLNDGSSIHVTSAEWLTPTEQSIALNGLEPDIALIPDENGRDVEYGEALRYLQSVVNKQAQ